MVVPPTDVKNMSRFWRKINFVNFRHSGLEVMINNLRTDI